MRILVRCRSSGSSRGQALRERQRRYTHKSRYPFQRSRGEVERGRSLGEPPSFEGLSFFGEPGREP